MNLKTLLKLSLVGLFIFLISPNVNAQTTISLKSQWLDPTNLYTEEKPTAEFNTTFPIAVNWSLTFYYAHDLENLTPIYLYGGVNNSHESKQKDSLVFSPTDARFFPKSSNNLFVSYQFSETQNQMSWVQPTYTWNWNFMKNSSETVHTVTAEVSAWMSIQRGDIFQDGGYVNAKYNFAKHFNNWVLNGNLSTIALGIMEPDRNIFVLGEVLSLSSTYLPYNTALEIVLNKPLITKDNSELGFTIGLIYEF